MSGGRRIHGALLRSYSPKFRERYGDEMTSALAEENRPKSIIGRFTNDIDFARNGIVQRMGATIAGDIESGARWAATASLVACIAWALASLTRSISWHQWIASNVHVEVIWGVVLLSATARLLLPRPWGVRALLPGLLVTGWSTIVGFTTPAPIPSGYIGLVEAVLRWQTLTIFLLLALGILARTPSRRFGLAAVGSGIASGVVLALRVDAVMSDRPLGTGTGGCMNACGLDSRLVQGFFLDLTRLDLIPAVGWWWLAIATVLSLIGWFRPRFAVAAIILTLPVIAIPIILRSVADASTAPRIEKSVVVVAIAVIIESAIALSINWRTADERITR